VSAWVVLAGALGDAVMGWPLVRAIARREAERGGRVVVVDAWERACLAAAEIGVEGVVPVSAERRELTRLWAGVVERGELVAACGGVEPRRVLSFAADPASPAGRAWIEHARASTGAMVEFVGRPGSAERRSAWRAAEVEILGAVGPRAGGRVRPRVVVHVGAGSREKRWPMASWAELVQRLRSGDRAVDVLAGEVEAERLEPGERATLASIGGRTLGTLAELAAAITAGGVFVGADTGPTHLAAQLGVRAVALFGPTEPAVWAPVGPSVRVVRATGATGLGRMEDLAVDRVVEAVRRSEV
jgi:heptosyltransferase III